MVSVLHPMIIVEITNAGFDPGYGVRPLKRAIQARLGNPLAEQILESQFAEGLRSR